MIPRQSLVDHEVFHSRVQTAKIDIDRLSEAELVDLNYRVVERRACRDAEERHEMAKR